MKEKCFVHSYVHSVIFMFYYYCVCKKEMHLIECDQNFYMKLYVNAFDKKNIVHSFLFSMISLLRPHILFYIFFLTLSLSFIKYLWFFMYHSMFNTYTRCTILFHNYAYHFCQIFFNNFRLKKNRKKERNIYFIYLLIAVV